MTKNKCIIDIETGGFSKENNGICEIGLVIIDENHHIIATYETLIEPYLKENSDQRMTYSDKAQEIHGISIYDLEQKGIQSEKACARISKLLIDNDCFSFIGHNIKSFDSRFLNHFFQRFCEIPIDFDDHFDTMIEAKETIASGNGYSLKVLCELFDIKNTNEHRSIGDCLATLELYKIIKEIQNNYN